jgi:hypothetical protein
LNTFNIGPHGPDPLEVPMDALFVTYLIYLLLSVVLTVWVASTLSAHGITFLRDVFRGNEALATSVNHLLVVGFYLVNLGFIAFNLRLGVLEQGASGATEALSGKLGLVLLVLGALHFFNLCVLHRLRRRALVEEAPPPVAPDGSVLPQAPTAG